MEKYPHIKSVAILQYKEIKQDILNAINSAKSSIYCELSGLSDNDIITSIENKVDEKIPLTIVFDEKKYNEGEIVLPKSTLFTKYKMISEYRLHSKYIIIDNLFVYIFTTSLQEKFNQQNPYDTILKIQNSNIAMMLSKEFISKNESDELLKLGIVIRDPKTKIDTINDMWKSYMHNANSIICYFKSCSKECKIMEDFRDISKKIPVRFILSPKYKENSLGSFGNIEVIVSDKKPDRLHTNIAFIDNVIYCGTWYPSKRCSTEIDIETPYKKSRELGIWINPNKDVIGTFLNKLQKI